MYTLLCTRNSYKPLHIVQFCERQVNKYSMLFIDVLDLTLIDMKN